MRLFVGTMAIAVIMCLIEVIHIHQHTKCQADCTNYDRPKDY